MPRIIPSALVVISNRKSKSYAFKRLLQHYPLGQVPAVIHPTKVVKALAETEQDGFGQGRVSWKEAK